MTDSKPKIALIGRPNVGKSTLFNRMTGKKMAIVNDTPGVTRDWRAAPASLFGRPVTVIDTAGLEESFDESIAGRMRRQTEQAIDACDLAIFMIDGRAGVTPMDEHFARFVRKRNLPVIVAVNKCEGSKGMETLGEAYRLGLGDAIPISAEHNEGVSALYDAVLAACPQEADEPGADDALDESAMPEDIDALEGDLDFDMAGADDSGAEPADDRPVKIAIVGRPNAGKSTLVNTLLGSDRVMVGPEAGITRDAVAVDWSYDGRAYTLVDTAGLRRRSKVVEIIETAATEDTYRAIRLAQVVILVLDGTLSLDKQDLSIAAHVEAEGRGLVIAVNKWDARRDKNEAIAAIRDRIARSFSQIPDIRIVTISALKNRNIGRLMDTVNAVYANWNKRVGTGVLNRWLAGVESRHPAPLVQTRPNRLRFMAQIKTRPPTFVLWLSRPDSLPDAYKRYVINQIRSDFDIPDVPIRLVLRTSKNPYAE